MIELKIINLISPESVIEDIKNGKLHLVALAENSLTLLNAYAVQLCGLPFDLVDQMVESVNIRQETGTLFPRANISIVPSSWSSKKLIDTELRKGVDDVLLANKQYIKARTILFSLEGSCNTVDILNYIRGLITDNKIDDQNLYEVWVEYAA